MQYKQSTQIPNFLIDKYLAKLTEAELKLLLIIIRQTVGWVNQQTGLRKTRDRISGYQFRQKTGLSKRIITKTIQMLALKQLIQITDFKGVVLNQPKERKGKSYLYYSFLQPAHLTTPTSAQNIPEPVHKRYHNKTKYIKLNDTKPKQEFPAPISTLIQHNRTLFKYLEK